MDQQELEARIAENEREQEEFQRRLPLQGFGEWSRAIDKDTIDWPEFVDKLERALVVAKEERDA